MTVTNALIWYVPDVGTNGRLAWYIILYTVMVLAWSGFSISYRTFLMFLSDDSSERDSAIMYRSMVIIGGVVAGTAMHGQILASYRRSEYGHCDNVTYSANSSTNSSEDEPSLEMTRTGYMISSATLCCLLMLSLSAIVFGTTERKGASTIFQRHPGESAARTFSGRR
ncbi:sphingosine-1-phosphate transporter MFSD2B-like [Branchiostoma lanceolatum]|uniref:sphingosine-1-phosphate transporter MFSD2B-like n=1 Tax=Branchiostoma lanceolatum TaxID=7740 RepID=UPI003452C9FD